MPPLQQNQETHDKTSVRVFQLEESNKELRRQNSTLQADFDVSQELARRDSILSQGMCCLPSHPHTRPVLVAADIRHSL